ncbi:MAG: LuxR C-terminal-related transcriptional regulator [Rhodospirillaceae bacterium]|nr:LuxR C-terminal-related transcriptional regulator [Rhodospirillaceae bacterium]
MRKSGPKTIVPAAPTAAPLSFWLPHHRIVVPERPSRYCNRPELTRRCEPARQPVVVLLAPGGFGKTTLLSAVCRDAMSRRVSVAWLTLSRDDQPGDLDAHLALAFQEAGIDLLGPLGRGETGIGQAYPRTAVLIRALEERTHPCILALDEAEHAQDPDAIGLLNYLLRNAPPCLHIAIAARSLPPGLDLAQPVLGERSTLLTAEDLRFTRADIARFFDLKLSRDQLAAVAAESNGWPIALQICRNDANKQGDAEARAARHVVDNWIAGRFWEGFSRADRELILDIGLLEWVDSALVEAICNDSCALERLLALPTLAGLLQPGGRNLAKVYRLHPLLREHCTDQRRGENPARFRVVHRRVAAALAHRGATLDAIRHSALAGDSALAGRIFVEAGTLQLWLREGTQRLLAAARFLPPADAEPRLAMTHCIALHFQGRLNEARRTLAAAPVRPNDPGFEIDRLLACGVLAINGCQMPDAEDRRLMEAAAARIADRSGTPTLVRAMLTLGLSISHLSRIDLAASVALARRARKAVVGKSAYITMMIDSHLGQIAMARGQVREALRLYRSSERISKARFLEDPALTIYSGLLMCELALERNRVDGNADPRRIVRDVCLRGRNFTYYAAAASLATALTLDSDGTEAALAVAEEIGEFARRAGLDPLHRHLAALRVSLLAEAQEVNAAQRTWRGSELPATDAGCLAVGAGGWRDLEAIACARIQLLAAAGNTSEADDLAKALTQLADERGLRRTLMRTLALRVRLCHRAGSRGQAARAAARYLALYARTDYARPLVRTGAAAAKALDRIVDADPEGPHAAAAERLIAMSRDGVPAKPRLTGRQKAVLGRLVSQQDKEIAAALAITPHGVRYHIRAIFKKLGVHSRTHAVRRARALGLLAPGDP